MANQLIYMGIPAAQSGLAVTASLFGMDGVLVSDGIALAEIGTTANYAANMPTDIPAGQYVAKFFSGQDYLGHTEGGFVWDGTKEIPAAPNPPNDADYGIAYADLMEIAPNFPMGKTPIFVFALSDKPCTVNGLLLKTHYVEASPDLNGRISVELARNDHIDQNGTWYTVNCRDFGIANLKFELQAAVYDLGGLIRSRIG